MDCVTVKARSESSWLTELEIKLLGEHLEVKILNDILLTDNLIKIKR